MKEPVSIGNYYWRFLRRVANDATPWARDNLVFAGGMFVLPLLVEYWRNHDQLIDWNAVKTTLWFYLVACGIYIAYHLIRTPWQLDAERAQALRQAQELETNQEFRENVHSLALSISDFIYERTKNAPPVPGWEPFFGGDAAAMLRRSTKASYQRTAAMQYESETIKMYEYRFARKVLEAIKKLDVMNIRLDLPDEFWMAPKNSEAIKGIGKNLAQLADGISEA